jgi:hypothetical protein
MDNFALIRFVVTVVVCAAVYLMLARRLADAVQPMRLDLAYQGQVLLVTGNLNHADANYVRFCLDNAFNGKVAFRGMFLLPFLGVWKLVRLCIAQSGAHAAAPASRSPNVDHVADLFWRSALVANPLCGMIVLAQMTVVIAIGVMISGQLKFVKSLLRAVAEIESAWSDRRRLGARMA